MYETIIVLHVNNSPKLSSLQDLFGDDIVTWQHFIFSEKYLICFS